MHARNGWLHYTTVEGKERAIRCDSIAAVLEEDWVTPDGKRWGFTHLRSRSGQIYRVPAAYHRVMPRALGLEED